MRRLPSGCTSTGTNAPSSSRARQIVTRRPCSVVHAPMCGESARTRRHASSGSSRSSSRSAGADLLGVGRRPSSGCGSNCGVRQHAVRAAAPRPRRSGAKTVPASSSGRSGTPPAPRSGPASSAATVSWIVTPVSSSPARIARSTGAAPRQRGSSDGMDVQPERLVEQRLRDQQAVGADHDRVDGLVGGSSGRSGWCTGIPSRSAASFAGGGASLRPRPRGASGRVSR